MKSIVVIISILLLSSCINENILHEAFPTHILHGNSAKVWILSKSSIPNDKNVAAMENYRKSYIFYSNERFREQELIHLGSDQGLVGRFDIKKGPNGNKNIVLYYKNGNIAYYEIFKIDNHNLILSDYDNNKATLEFHSLKPPKL